MMNRMRVKHDQKGFTLVELMIVVAIIGILAAIAIPQFAQYRLRGFNASAQSDLRNLATSQAAFFADYLIYGNTGSAVGAAGGLGTVMEGPPSNATPIMIKAQTGNAAINRFINLPVGNLVQIVAHTNAETGTVAQDVSFTAVSKHRQGDTWFGADGDSSAVYTSQDATNGVGLALAQDHCPVSRPNTNEFDPGTPPVTTATAWAAR